MKHSRKVRALQNLAKNKVIFPLIWADESAELDEAFVEDFKSRLLTPVKIIGIVKWVVLILGIVLFILGLVVFVVKYFVPSVGNLSGFGGLQQPKSSVQATPQSSTTESRSSVSTIG